MKNPACAEAGCVCADCHVNPEEQVRVRPLSANYPRLSANFCHFPPLSATFRHFREFPPISATFRTLRWRSRRTSGNFRHNFRKISTANSRSAVCTAWAWSHCAVEIVVHSGSAPGETAVAYNVRPIEGFAQRQSQLLMQCHQDISMYDNNQAAFRDCCNAVRLGSVNGGKSSELLNKRRFMPKNKKKLQG